MNRQYYNKTQNDRWIVEHIFPGKQQGYFIEAGAANGIFGSCCYVLEKEFNWQGICVEPNDKFYQQLIKNRSNSICEKVCLHYQTGEVIYVEGSENTVSPFLGGVKIALERMADNFKSSQSVIKRSKEVISKGKLVKRESITLEDLLEKYNYPEVIDYGAFDISGSELNVLSVFPFKKYRFLALSLELDIAVQQLVTDFLSAKGYREAKNPFNQDMLWEKYYLHDSLFP